ncbi:biotin--[acetyl-CoA-carboxylase] ligase [Clostridium sp. PL3]|uniref:Bifunctional ligase/repressor BirA n=1 Tax=Clostridium thailandense TaxID=2794346 RepID=A0A949TZH0_9CLOT|nr:biotin--[acetyl-CoA-carboxylase] ligase [Clostridium thailandense]MBV7276521.1 biotin--[acetyl-CoA-carboxylase] ligase [Clostridium thailandense]
MKDKILHLLKENEGDFISGQLISKNLGVSRTAIWKYINSLKDAGYQIESISKRGYRLLSSPDLLTFEEISANLNTSCIGRNIMYFQTIDSTNNKAKELANASDNGTVIISEEQTSGRGRLGRAWKAPKFKGIWMSIILKPDIDPPNIPKITQVGAAAVIKTLNDFNINAYVKWPNDIILNNKKVCGILTEMSGELNRINYVVMGIGINVSIKKEEFPESLRDTATSLICETGNELKRKDLVTKLLNNFEILYNEFAYKNDITNSIKICRENSILIGKEIRVVKINNELFGKAIDLNEAGELVVQYADGTIENIVSGEVSIRGLHGKYVP